MIVPSARKTAFDRVAAATGLDTINTVVIAQNGIACPSSMAMPSAASAATAVLAEYNSAGHHVGTHLVMRPLSASGTTICHNTGTRVTCRASAGHSVYRAAKIGRRGIAG